jgi:hypothetical protein
MEWPVATKVILILIVVFGISPCEISFRMQFVVVSPAKQITRRKNLSGTTGKQLKRGVLHTLPSREESGKRQGIESQNSQWLCCLLCTTCTMHAGTLTVSRPPLRNQSDPLSSPDIDSSYHIAREWPLASSEFKSRAKPAISRYVESLQSANFMKDPATNTRVGREKRLREKWAIRLVDITDVPNRHGTEPPPNPRRGSVLKTKRLDACITVQTLDMLELILSEHTILVHFCSSCPCDRGAEM